MVTRGISRGSRKLTRTPSLSKKKKKKSTYFTLVFLFFQIVALFFVNSSSTKKSAESYNIFGIFQFDCK